MANKGLLRPEEKEHIRINCLNRTDEALAKDLNRNIRTIISYRKSLGIIKKPGGTVERERTGVNAGDLKASQSMTEDQRKEFFKIQLTNSLYYKTLKEQFTKDELDYYLEEWASLCTQFEDIVATEKRQIDELIKAEIMGNSILKYINVSKQEAESLIKEVETLRKLKDMETDEDAQNRDSKLLDMIRTVNTTVQVMTHDYQKNVDLKNRLLDQLNARRRDRVDQIKKSKTTFVGLIESLRDKKNKEQQGRQLELIRLAREKKKKEWRQATKFPDGNRDCILLDEFSELPTTENYRGFLNDYEYLKDKRVLIIEDDLRRKQIFSEILKANKIEFASNVEKAVIKLKDDSYDMILLDYDLGMSSKGSEVAEYIIQNDIGRNSQILVHSCNKEGADRIQSILGNQRQVEVCSFDTIMKSIGDKNAKNSISLGEEQGSGNDVKEE